MRKFWLLSIICGLTVFGTLLRPLPSALSNDTSIEQSLFFKAEALCRKGKAKDAIPDLKRVLTLNPTHAGALYYAGLCEWEKKNAQRAKYFFSQAGKDPEYGNNARKKLAEITIFEKQLESTNSVDAYVENGAFEQGLQEGLAALSHQPDDQHILFNVVFAATMTGDQPTAEKHVQTLLSISPPPPHLDDLQMFVEGWFLRESDPNEALQRLLVVKDKRLLTASTKKEIRRLLLKGNQFQMYEEILRGDISQETPEKETLTHELARFYLDQGLYEKGRELLETRPVESMPDNLLFLELLTLSAQEERAMNLASRLLETWPNDPDLHSAFLKSFMNTIQRTAAIPQGTYEPGKKYSDLARKEIFRLVEKAKTIQAPIHFYLGARAALALDQDEDAFALIRLATALSWDEDAEKDALAAANELNRKNHAAEAGLLFEYLLNQNPSNTVAAINLAELNFKSGKTPEALKIIEKASAQDLRNFKAFSLLVDCLAACGRVEEAQKKVLDKLAEPDLPDLLISPLKVMAYRLADMVQTNVPQ